MIDYNDYIMYDKAIITGSLKAKDMEGYNEISRIVSKIFNDDIVTSLPDENLKIYLGGSAYYADELFKYLQSKISPYLTEATIEYEIPSQIPGNHSNFFRHILPNEEVSPDRNWFIQKGQITYQGFQMWPISKYEDDKSKDIEIESEEEYEL